MIIISNKFKEKIWIAEADLDDDTFKVALLQGTSGLATSAIQAMEYINDISAYNVTENASTINITDATLTGTGTTTSATGDATRRVWTADNVEWPNATVWSDALVIYDTTRSDLLVCYMRYTTTKTANAGSFVITWNSNGILNLSS